MHWFTYYRQVDRIDHDNGGAAVQPPWNLQQHTRSRLDEGFWPLSNGPVLIIAYQRDGTRTACLSMVASTASKKISSALDDNASLSKRKDLGVMSSLYAHRHNYE